MLQIAICDDQQQDIERLKILCISYFHEHQTEIKLHCFTSAQALLDSKVAYHMYLLDVLMPEYNGIDLAYTLNEQYSDPLIIYTTSSKEFALQAYEVGTVQYLVKPLTQSNFTKVMDHVLPRLQEQETDYIIFPTPQGTLKCRLDSISFIEHYNKVLKLHTKENMQYQSSNSSLTLSKLCDQLLPFDQFIAPHRAFLINIDDIVLFSHKTITMSHKQVIPISQKRFQEIKEYYFQYLLKKGTS